MMNTGKCPVCGHALDREPRCPGCGWDVSADHELYPTLFSAAGAPSRLARSERARAAAAEAEREALFTALGKALFSAFPTEVLRECAGASDIPAAAKRLLAPKPVVPPPPPRRKEPWSENIPGSFSSLPWRFGADKVEVIRFRDTLRDVPGDAVDISAAKNGSVMAYHPTERRFIPSYNYTDKGRYVDAPQYAVMFICAEGGVCAPEDAGGFFRHFPALRSIDFGGCFHTEDCRSTADMFKGCAALEELDLSGFDTARVTNMSGMFYGCKSLKALDLRSFDTSRVTDMSYMFNGCTALTAVDVSRFNTAGVTKMTGMFNGCGALASVNVRSFDTARVTDMSYMFNGCFKLAEPDLRSFVYAEGCRRTGMLSGVRSGK